jgi:hypothetical protein
MTYCGRVLIQHSVFGSIPVYRQERDPESGLDEFGARYYASQNGKARLGEESGLLATVELPKIPFAARFAGT